MVPFGFFSFKPWEESSSKRLKVAQQIPGLLKSRPPFGFQNSGDDNLTQLDFAKSFTRRETGNSHAELEGHVSPSESMIKMVFR